MNCKHVISEVKWITGTLIKLLAIKSDFSKLGFFEEYNSYLRVLVGPFRSRNRYKNWLRMLKWAVWAI